MKKVLRNVIFVILTVIIVYFLINSRNLLAIEMEYSDFVSKLKNNEVSSVLVEENENRAFIYLKEGASYYVVNLASFADMQSLIFEAKELDPTIEYSARNFKKPSFFSRLFLTCAVFLILKTIWSLMSIFLSYLTDLFRHNNTSDDDNDKDNNAENNNDENDENDEQDAKNKKKEEEIEKKLSDFIEKLSSGEDNFTYTPRIVSGMRTRFTDVIGLENQLDELNDVVSFLKEPDAYRKMNASIPKGILLYGPSGTGKTLIARAIAGEAGVSFIYASASQLQSMYVGGSERNIRKLFEIAKKRAPSIIFLDEIDSIATQRYSENSSKYAASILNQLLTCIDGFEESSGVIVIAATNCKEVLDNAILRRGRFDRHIYIPLPDKNARVKLFKYYLQNKICEWEFDGSTYQNTDAPYEEFASMTTGFSGSDIKTLVNEATILSVRAGRDQISMSDVYEAHRKITVGVKNGRMENNEEEKKLTAVHEAGHAIISRLLNKTPLEISIIPRSTAGGYNLFADKEKSYYSVEDIMKELKIALGGRAAEKVIYDRVFSGASSDLKHASEMLYQMYMVFGMSASEEVSLVLTNNNELNSSITKDSVTNMKTDLKRCYDDVVELLRNNITVLEQLTLLLVKVETLQSSEIEKFFAEFNI